MMLCFLLVTHYVKGFILFLLTEAVPTVPYEILKMEKKSGTDI